MSAGMMAAAVRKRNRFPRSMAPEDGQRNDVHIASLAGVDDAEAAVAATCQAFRATAPGPPLRMSSSVMEQTSSRVTAPPIFSRM